MREFILKSHDEDIGQRLDLFILKKLLEQNVSISRSAVQRLIKDGKITTLDSHPLKSHYKIKKEEIFKVILEEDKDNCLPQPEDIPLKIIYDDDDIAVIDKPQGLVVHPGAGNKSHTLVNALLYHFDKLSQVDPRRPGIVHRLDKDTSGIMIVAKNDHAHRNLAKQFSEHTVRREYIAIVKGKVEFDEEIIEFPIGRDAKNRKKQSVGFSKHSRYAKTLYRTILRREDASLLKLIPFTGRTHQLRVHLSFIGHPILGDTKYSRERTFPRLALHAYLLGVKHPKDDRYIEFISEIPAEFMSYFGLKQLKI